MRMRDTPEVIRINALQMKGITLLGGASHIHHGSLKKTLQISLASCDELSFHDCIPSARERRRSEGKAMRGKQMVHQK
ncbi:hypothetical protein [Caballeronia cordobensis]|uniref:hypothetical protein n=1 Tax=Caballeronia cordobensis TaxID=1353886 RepID=UPI0011847AD4